MTIVRRVAFALALGLAAACLAGGPALAKHAHAHAAPAKHAAGAKPTPQSGPTPTTDIAQPADPTADPQPLPDSGVAAQLAAWVVASGDNTGLPFAIIDKLATDIFVYDADGTLLGEAPALVGLARGDDSTTGVGGLALSAVRPRMRTTPAGRFVAGFGPATGHEQVLWVDYADAIGLHPVVTTNPKEQRLKRIRSPEAKDHRISFGCINVPADFYNDVVLTAFAGGNGVVYILPDTKPISEVFPTFAVARNDGAATPPEPPARVVSDLPADVLGAQ